MRALIVALSLLVALPAGATQAARMPRWLANVDEDVRRALSIPEGWTVAPPVASLTSDPEAIADLTPLQQRIAALAPGVADARLHHELGNAFASRRLAAPAATHYLQALALDPSSVPTLDNLGALLHRAGALRDAEDVLERAHRLDPDNALVIFNLANVKADLGDGDEAAELYITALSMDPSLWLPHNNPAVIGNIRAERALHALFMRQGGPMTFKLDRPSSP